MVISKKTIIFQDSRGPTFSRGCPNACSYRNLYNFEFSGGGPLSTPSGSVHVTLSYMYLEAFLYLTKTYFCGNLLNEDYLSMVR